MAKAKKLKKRKSPAWLASREKVDAEAKRQGLPGFLLRLNGGVPDARVRRGWQPAHLHD